MPVGLVLGLDHLHPSHDLIEQCKLVLLSDLCVIGTDGSEKCSIGTYGIGLSSGYSCSGVIPIEDTSSFIGELVGIMFALEALAAATF